MADIKVFAETLEDSAKEQIEEISACPAFEGSKIRIMPDAHRGKGCVIGFTANLGDQVIPNSVGVDITSAFNVWAGAIILHLMK